MGRWWVFDLVFDLMSGIICIRVRPRVGCPMSWVEDASKHQPTFRVFSKDFKEATGLVDWITENIDIAWRSRIVCTGELNSLLGTLI